MPLFRHGLNVTQHFGVGTGKQHHPQWTLDLLRTAHAFRRFPTHSGDATDQVPVPRITMSLPAWLGLCHYDPDLWLLFLSSPCQSSNAVKVWRYAAVFEIRRVPASIWKLRCDGSSRLVIWFVVSVSLIYIPYNISSYGSWWTAANIYPSLP